jgi:deoxyribonuclease V
MNRFAADGFAGFVNLSYPSLEIIGESVIKDRIPMPYIPGLLSFREMPMLVKAWEKLPVKPDVLMADGIGIAHPRRLGIASHLGLALGIPTIGCAKSVLTGVYDEPGLEAGSVSYLRDRKDPSDIIGAAVRTKRNVAPMFISPGHLITLEDSIRLVLACVRKHRLPEPTRQAHLAVNRYRIADAA